MSLAETGVEMVKVLLPPKNVNDPEEQQRWRWVIFSSVIALSLALAAHVLMACGLVPVVFPGFAPATAVDVVRQRVDLIATESLERAMRDKVSQRCRAKDDTLREELTEDLDRLERDYYDINSRYYKQPSCAEL